MIRAALADEDFAAANDQSGGDEAKGRSGGAGMGIKPSVFHVFSVDAPKGVQDANGKAPHPKADAGPGPGYSPPTAEVLPLAACGW